MSDEKQNALDGEMGKPSHDKDHDHDKSYENESTRDHTPMVQITLRAVYYTHMTLQTI